MTIRETLKSFNDDPFTFVDRLNLQYKWLNLNFYQNYIRVRRSAFMFSIIMLVMWGLCGFDSTPLQFIYFFGSLVTGQGWTQSIQQYHHYYGKEMHYSAFVIYGLAFWFISRYLAKHFDIVKSRNIAYSVSIVLLSVAVFEFYWMGSYSIFQVQHWVTTFKMPQLRIILQNVMFLIVGFIGILYMYIDGHDFNEEGDVIHRRYRFNVNWKLIVLVLVTVFFALLWIYYPLSVDSLSVPLTSGEVWTNTNMFPQTLYTIDIDPFDGVNAGVWFYIENNLVHALNTWIKVLTTSTFIYALKLKRVEP